VKALLAGHSFSGSFESCLKRELPFRIPIWNDGADGKFVYADSVYGPYLDSWIMHILPSPTSEMSVCGMDGNWLSAVKLLIETAVIHVNQHHYSSKAKLRPDGVITVNGALASIIESKAQESEMITAANEIPSKLNPTAYKAFPLNQMSIPGFASCSTCVTLHSVAYDHATKRFTQVQLKKYEMSIMGHRLLFLVDLFKILTWMVTLQSSQQLEHLVPGVKRKTSNGHFVTWIHAGLLKQFSREGIRLDLIHRAYAAGLQHVERGTANSSSVTITSIGKTLHNAIRMGVVVDAESVIAQLRLAVDELHGLGIAHCDICSDNMFVLDDRNVILGDLEYCTEVTSLPPQVRRLYGTPATALELDELQVLRCNDDIRVMMNA